jgi:putative DNA primase/helicase
MPVAHQHLVSSPQPGTGKAYLADIAAMIATGERMPVIAAAPKPEETEKRLVGSALDGFPIIGLDNCRETLAGDFLCQVTERPLMRLRALGKSDMVRIPNSFTTFATGNNLTVADDLVRRTVSSTLDANVENPEERSFTGNPLFELRQNRGAYVAACLTIVRAYLAAGSPERLVPLPSYEGWSEMVRAPLVWLGFDDPVATMAKAREADAVRQDRAGLFAAWLADLGTEAYTAAAVVEAAEARYPDDSSKLVRPDLNAALLAVAAKRGGGAQIDPRRLGRWLTKNEDTIAGGLKLTIDRGDARRPRYRIRPQP